MKTLYIDSNTCTACRVCELVCSLKHQGIFNPKKSFIHIAMKKELGIRVPVLSAGCTYCGECVEWCPENCLDIMSLEEAVAMRKIVNLGAFPVPNI